MGYRYGGAQSKYKKEHCKLAIEYGREGKSTVYVANAIGVTKHTINDWEKKFPEFGDAMALNRSLCEEWLLERAREKCMGISQGSDKMITFLLAASHGYRDKEKEVTITPNGDGKVAISFINSPVPDDIDTTSSL